MLYEFALDPAAVVSWRSREQYRYAIESFATGGARVPACVPRKHWRRLVLEALANAEQHERKFIEALVQYLFDRKSSRHVMDWNNGAPWLAGALAEHLRQPFHAIVSTGHADEQPVVLTEEDFDPANALWHVQRSCRIARTSEAYAAALRGLIWAARTVSKRPFWAAFCGAA
jgi:hypothetical protein